MDRFWSASRCPVIVCESYIYCRKSHISVVPVLARRNRALLAASLRLPAFNMSNLLVPSTSVSGQNKLFKKKLWVTGSRLRFETRATVDSKKCDSCTFWLVL